MSERVSEEDIIPGSGYRGASDAYNIEGRQTPETRPVIPLGQKSYDEEQPRMGFFTDTTVCIGCKACEVACKEWNHVPSVIDELTGNSYDNTGDLGANTWRHVAFIEQRKPVKVQEGESGVMAPAEGADEHFRWLMSSDVCKHCTEAPCLDVCPTGSLIRTELGSVVVQEDICNGCGYCIPACPFGVLDQRENDGRAWKCTLCYDRTRDGLEPACAQACPTDSIQYGPLDELREKANGRLEMLHEAGETDAHLYGADEEGYGMGAFFLLRDDPEVYGLPPDPEVVSRKFASLWGPAAAAAGALAVGVAASFLGGSR